jgi:hypothetical protein
VLPAPSQEFAPPRLNRHFLLKIPIRKYAKLT